MRPLRTALVNPPDVFALGDPEENATPPLGLAYIAAVLRESGFAADLFDLAHEQPLSAARLREKGFFDYDLYGFTAYSKSFTSALDVLALLREENAEAVVVFGGPHASPNAEELLQEYSGMDAVICNEGEYPMLELARHLETGAPTAAAVPNLVYREGGFERRRRDGRGDTADPVRRSLVTRSVDDLDALPHPVRDYRIEPDRLTLRYDRRDQPVAQTHVVSSRGCPKRCTFCSIVVASPKYRIRSVESLMTEIRELDAQSPFGHIFFTDANFFVSAKRTLAFSLALEAWRPEVTWSGTATADMVLRHAGILPEIRRNCVQLEIGIESGSATQLARFNKRTSLEDNRAAIRLLRRYGISLGLDFIMFDPEATLAEVRENLAFLHEAELWGTSPPSCLFNGMRLYPGTPARDTYLRLLGLPTHHLASIEPPFVNPAVAALYGICKEYLSTYQIALTDALKALQARWREEEAGDAPAGVRYSQRQRIAALMIDLQYEPYRFFDEVLGAFESRALGAHSSIAEAGRLTWRERVLRLLHRAMRLVERRHAAPESLQVVA